MSRTTRTTTQTAIVLASLLLLVFVPSLAQQDDDYDDESYVPPEDTETVDVTTGYQEGSSEGNPDLAAEWNVIDSTAILGLGYKSSPYDRTTAELFLRTVSSTQFHAGATFDMNRKYVVDVQAVGFPHRLLHDSLDNLQAVSDVKVVRRTDFAPGQEYGIRYRLFDIHADFQPPQTPGFTWRGGYRRQERNGTRQQLNTSHCTSCHATAQGRDVDSEIADAYLGFHWGKGLVDLDYSINTRQYEDRAATPTAPFEKAYHPGFPAGAGAGLQTPFNDRLWFQDGTYPVGAVPQVNRMEHLLRARAYLDRSGVLNFTVVYSDTENRLTSAAYSFRGFRGRYSYATRDKHWRFNVHALRDEIENDNLFVDLPAINEPLTGPPQPPVTTYPAPYGGPLTFEQWRNLVPGLIPGETVPAFNQYTRLSAFTRTTNRLKLDAYWRPGRRSTGFASYQLINTDRDNVVLADGSGETTTHRLKLAWNQRIYKRLRWNNALTATLVDNPYVSVDGGLRYFAGYVNDDPGQGVLGAAGSPKSDQSLQYYQLHALRVANIGNKPTQALKLRSYASWAPAGGRMAVGANVRLGDAENDELDWSKWESQTAGIGANFWVRAAPTLQVTLGVDHTERETSAEAFVPLMDG
jgi:hypothetical protein